MEKQKYLEKYESGTFQHTRTSGGQIIIKEQNRSYERSDITGRHFTERRGDTSIARITRITRQSKKLEK